MCGWKVCRPFKKASSFADWFKEKCYLYLDLDGKLEEGVTPHPHLLRGLYGDWLEDDLGFSEEQTAAMAGDDVKTFRRYYLRRKEVYDATPAWTAKNQEIKARGKVVKVRGKATGG